MTFHFNKRYFLLAVLLFAVEVFIAICLTDRFIRPFVGDALVVILVYCAVSAFLKTDYRKIAVGTFVFACLIEICQYFDYVKLLGLENNRILATMLGRTFEWMDFAAYFAGFLTVLLYEKIFRSRKL